MLTAAIKNCREITSYRRFSTLGCVVVGGQKAVHEIGNIFIAAARQAVNKPVD